MLTWHLGTADTQITIGVDRNKLFIHSLQNAARRWEWIRDPVKMPFLERVKANGSVCALDWAYQPDETIWHDDDAGQELILPFRCKSPDLLLKTVWRAYPGPGPVEYAATLQNNAGGDVEIQSSELVSADLRFRADDWVTLTRFCKSSDLRGPDGHLGIFQNRLIAHAHIPAITHNVDDCGAAQSLIPYLVFASDTGHGVYFGYEWSFGDMSVGTGPDPMSFRCHAKLWNTGEFTAENGKIIKVPVIYLGTFQGDLDDAGNQFKKWFWAYKIPESLRKSENEPLLEYCVPGNEAGLRKYFADNDMPAWGGELAKIDIDWLSREDGWFGEDIVTWRPDPASWPNGMNAGEIVRAVPGQKLSLYMNNTYKWCDLGTKEGRELEREALESRFLSIGFDYYRSDFWCENNARSGLGPDAFQGGARYLSHEGYMQILDGMIAKYLNFRYEHCDAGGTLKDFDSLQRITVLTAEDSATPDGHRQAMYSCLYAINPVQLKADVAILIYDEIWPDMKNNASWIKYCLRTGFMGANMATSWGEFTPEMARQARAHWPVYTSKMRPVLRQADVYHILPMCDGVNWDGMEYFNPALGKGAVLLFKPSMRAADGDSKVIRLKGLVPETAYAVSFLEREDQNCRMTGRALMNGGLLVKGMTGDYASEIIWIG
jgi:hypothetical protein